MPIRHVVMFTWADHVDGDHIAKVGAALSALPPAIPEIRSYLHGADLGVSEGNYDYVVVGDFDSFDDYAVYRDHPQHTAMIGELIKGHITNRAAVQYET